MSTTPETLLTSKQITDRRTSAPHVSMFARMLLRAAVLRRRRAASALLAMIVAAAVATRSLQVRGKRAATAEVASPTAD